jgi:hypothetical protein
MSVASCRTGFALGRTGGAVFQCTLIGTLRQGGFDENANDVDVIADTSLGYGRD